VLFALKRNDEKGGKRAVKRMAKFNFSPIGEFLDPALVNPGKN